jgi:hypothetical protein
VRQAARRADQGPASRDVVQAIAGPHLSRSGRPGRSPSDAGGATPP